MKNRNLLLISLSFLLISFSAFALDLHEARKAGLVGEKFDGYAAALKATPEVQAFVNDVNSKRETEYARISAEKGQPKEVVAKLAAQQIISTLEPGDPYQAADGSWKTR